MFIYLFIYLFIGIWTILEGCDFWMLVLLGGKNPWNIQQFQHQPCSVKPNVGPTSSSVRRPIRSGPPGRRLSPREAADPWNMGPKSETLAHRNPCEFRGKKDGLLADSPALGHTQALTFVILWLDFFSVAFRAFRTSQKLTSTYKLLIANSSATSHCGSQNMLF